MENKILALYAESQIHAGRAAMSASSTSRYKEKSQRGSPSYKALKELSGRVS